MAVPLCASCCSIVTVTKPSTIIGCSNCIWLGSNSYVVGGFVAAEAAARDDAIAQVFRVGDTTYATQFHPELDADGMCTRIDVYKNHGYFAPEAAESTKSAALQRNVE